MLPIILPILFILFYSNKKRRKTPTTLDDLLEEEDDLLEEEDETGTDDAKMNEELTAFTEYTQSKLALALSRAAEKKEKKTRDAQRKKELREQKIADEAKERENKKQLKQAERTKARENKKERQKREREEKQKERSMEAEKKKEEKEKKKQLAAEALQHRGGVIYLGHLPYGFFEEQMQPFFSQFGEVKQLRLSRNTKGKSRHYAFVEFQKPEVAEAVAQAMDGYLMFGRKLVCRAIPREQVGEKMFTGAGKRLYVAPNKHIQRETHNKARTRKQEKARLHRLLHRERNRSKRLSSLGLNLDTNLFEKELRDRKPKRVKIT